MQLAEITVAELPDFMNSSLWHQLEPKPLTPLRAFSQFHNPRARQTDTALIIAYENNSLIALVGLLPNLVNGQVGQIAHSNTGWWVDAAKGKQLAIPLFLKAFAKCNQRMFMTNCTPHTLSILQKTNWFEFPQTAPGRRGFLKFNLNEVIPTKLPAAIKLKPLLKMMDLTINILMSPVQIINRLRFTKKVPQVEYLTSLPPELHSFIEIHSEKEFTRRSGADLEWIMKYPWIEQKNHNQSVTAIEYPFSHLVGSFEQYFVKITASGQTIGLLFISVRDGHLRVPYVYFQEKDALQVLKVIYQQVVLKNVITLTVFCPKLVNLMDSVSHPFIFKKKIKRLMAISKQLTDLYLKYPEIQDGDGDVAFT